MQITFAKKIQDFIIFIETSLKTYYSACDKGV